MRRISSLLFVFIFVLILTAVFQETAVYSQPAPPIPANTIRLDLQPIDDLIPNAVNDLVTGNSCNKSTNIPVSENGGGGTVYVGNLSTDASDPNLSACTWGTPADSRGYRSAWYQFTTSYAGMATIKTYGSNYDTIASVFTGSCGTLQTVSCNDDAEGFASEITFPVAADTVYYLEIADWQNSYGEPPLLYVAAWLNPIVSKWEEMTSLPSQLSRHATAVVGSHIYVMGGQTIINSSMSNKMYRLNAANGRWTTMSSSSMPGNGYANTTAAYVNGNIYLPGGYDGLGSISNIHRVYNIGIDLWSTAAAPSGASLAWAQAVPVSDGYYLTGGSNYIGNALPPPSMNPPTSTITVSDRLLFYRPSSGAWETKTAMQAPRFAHTAGLVGGQVCVAGGLQVNSSGGSVLVTSGECYNGSRWSYTGTMNEPRFAAASAVGSDGKWYVFGGLTVSDEGYVIGAVSSEVYDPATNRWNTLPPSFNLGRFDDRQGYVLPNRTWAVGGTVGDRIWIIGGNIPTNGSTMPLAERLQTATIPPQYANSIYIPIIFKPKGAPAPAPAPNTTFNTMANAMPIASSVPRQDDFSEQRFYHAYVFDAAGMGRTVIEMTGIADGNNYDLFLYDGNKGLLAYSANPGAADERIERTLATGRYYVMVKRTSQINAHKPYQLVMRR